MAVVSSKRRDNKRGTENDKSRQLIEEYIIQVDSTDDEPSTIYDSSNEDVPKVGDPHPTDPNVTVKSVRVNPTDNRLWYIMEVTYDNNSDSQSPGGGGGGIEVLKVTIDSWYEDFILEREYDKPFNDIRDSADSKIKLEATRPQPLITITANTKDPALFDFVSSLGQVNDQPVTWLGMTFQRDQLLFDKYSSTSTGNNTWSENFVFKGKLVPDISGGQTQVGRGREWGWQARLVDAGFWERKEQGGNTVRVPILVKQDADKKASPKPVSDPWPLNGEGEALTISEIEQGQRFFRTFTIYPRMDFSVFNFDFESLLTRKLEKKLGL